MNKINIKPLADRVLVEPLPAETTTASGLIIPDSAKEKRQYGKVVALGTIENPGISVGDFVYFKKLNNDIEKIKKQLEKNTKDIEVIKKAGGRIIDATSLKDLYYNLHLPTSTYEERKLVLIELLKQR